MIDKKYLIESWRRGTTSDGNEFPYVYGWHLERRYDIVMVYHTGSTRGFRNIIYRIPEKMFTIIILTNRNSGNESGTLGFANKIADLYFSAK